MFAPAPACVWVTPARWVAWSTGDPAGRANAVKLKQEIASARVRWWDGDMTK